MSFQDRLAAAKAAPKASMDLEVLLDADLSDQIGQLEAERDRLADDFKRDARLGAVDQSIAVGERIDEMLSSATVDKFRFYRMDGLKWAALIAEHPPRTHVALDLRYGFNLHEVTPVAVVSCGRLLDGENEVSLPKEQWNDLLTVLSGHEVERIADALFVLNEWDPERAVQRAKKASARQAGSAQKSS
jgi:hypothetical protein